MNVWVQCFGNLSILGRPRREPERGCLAGARSPSSLDAGVVKFDFNDHASFGFLL